MTTLYDKDKGPQIILVCKMDVYKVSVLKKIYNLGVKTFLFLKQTLLIVSHKLLDLLKIKLYYIIIILKLQTLKHCFSKNVLPFLTFFVLIIKKSLQL